jgi:HlyD family secretion protein
MKKKILIGALIIVIAVSVFSYYLFARSAKSGDQYTFGEINYGDIENTISSSGTLSPVTTVEIGTQVSGTLARVYVDYNDVVKKGQLLAVVDTVLLKTSVMDAEAGLTKAEAQLEQAQADYQRNQSLLNNKMISDSDFLPFSVNLKTQQASLVSAQADLQRARRNLENAYIYAPISGTIIEKSVEAGQTVAASFSTPTLFIIAEDLSSMEILGEVAESDIGSVKVGQSVRFDVQAYPNKEFEGKVSQIRLQPQTVSNVVTYTVVVTAANPDGLLLPGMTANIDFIIERHEHILLAPNTALRFQPSEKVAANYYKLHKPPEKKDRDSTYQHKGSFAKTSGTSQNMQAISLGKSGLPANMARIWYLDNTNNIAMETIKTGMTDGNSTEIVMSHDIQPGMKVITGLAAAAAQNNSKTASSRSMRPMGPPRF